MTARIAQLIFSLVMASLAFLGTHTLLRLPTSPLPQANAAFSERGIEPVVIKNIFTTVPIDQIYVYRQVGSAFEQIPFQIDEVTSAGSYTATEDGLMDANDELVLLAQDLGSQATSFITATLPISSAHYELEVSDPLSPTAKSWAYLVRSTVLTPNNSTDYVDYIPANRQLNAASYSIGWAAQHGGIDVTAFFGSGDVLDRTKSRVNFTFLGNTVTITEENPLFLPPPDLILHQDGPVRVIVSRGIATTYAYASYVQTVTPVDLRLVPGTINQIRVSTDLTNTITNAIFYNENVPAGVPIDGSPDVVSSSLTKAWRQISLDSGTTIQLAELSSTGGNLSHYYRDDSNPDPTDTGDQVSYGDSGIILSNPTLKLFTVTTAQYFLPGQQGNRGDEFYNFSQHPLQLLLRFKSGQHSLFLPVILADG